MKFENDGSQETFKNFCFVEKPPNLKKELHPPHYVSDMTSTFVGIQHEGSFSMTILKMKGQCDHLKAQAKHALLTNDHEVLVENT